MKRDDLVAPRVVLRQLDGRFDGFRARIAEINFLRLLAGSDRRELLRQFHHARVIKIRAGNVNQLGGLLLNRVDHPRMAMPRGDDGDARGKIQKHVAVHVLDHRAAAALRHQRIAARVGRRNKFVSRSITSWPWAREAASPGAAISFPIRCLGMTSSRNGLFANAQTGRSAQRRSRAPLHCNVEEEGLNRRRKGSGRSLRGLQLWQRSRRIVDAGSFICVSSGRRRRGNLRE